MSTKPVLAPSSDAMVSRRGFLMKLGILFNGFAAMVLAVPVVGFLFFVGYARSCERLSLVGATRVCKRLS